MQTQGAKVSCLRHTSFDRSSSSVFLLCYACYAMFYALFACFAPHPLTSYIYRINAILFRPHSCYILKRFLMYISCMFITIKHCAVDLSFIFSRSLPVLFFPFLCNMPLLFAPFSFGFLHEQISQGLAGYPAQVR